VDGRVLAACQRDVQKRFLDVDDRHNFRKVPLSSSVGAPAGLGMIYGNPKIEMIHPSVQYII
jgi:hypothetical protein